MARARAKLRKEQADARRAELAAAEEEGLVVQRAELDAILGRVAAGIRRVITSAPAMIDTLGLDPADADRLRPVLIRTVEQIRLLIARQIEQGEMPVVEVAAE
jgi:phage terminase Nu1 subunit (DNA packaging protein)